LDVTSFAGKVVGGVLEWAGEVGVPHRAVITGQVTAEARDELSVAGPAQLLVLTDRVWQAGEAFARAAVLVEEAAVEAGGAALDPRPVRRTAAHRRALPTRDGHEVRLASLEARHRARHTHRSDAGAPQP